VGKFFIPAEKKSRQKEGALAENGLHVCRTIFSTSAAFLLASRVKKVTCVTQRFFWRQKKVTPVHHLPAGIYGFLAGKKKIKFYFRTKRHTRKNSSLS
jgi:hypothetical protein